MLNAEIPLIRKYLESLVKDVTPETPVLKEGVTVTKNGKLMLNGKFIRKEEAYV